MAESAAPEATPEKPAKTPKVAAPGSADPGINANVTGPAEGTDGREKAKKADPDDPGINVNVVS